MSMDLLAIILFLVAIILAFVRHVNIGIVALAMGVICVRIFGLTDKNLISGISSGMFCTLVGITLLFAIIKQTGALDLLAKKIVSSTGNRVWLLPITIYIAGFVIAGVGPGAIPALAIIPALAVTTAIQVGYDPLMLALIGEFGLMAGRMTSITPEAAIITNAATSAGFGDVMPTVLVCQTLVTFVYGIVVFIVFKGYKLKAPKQNLTDTKLPSFTRDQILSLLGIPLMLLLMIGFKVNIGLAAFFASAILVLCGVAKDGEALKALPWSTIIMVVAVGALLGVVNKVGGIKLMSSAISPLPLVPPSIFGICINMIVVDIPLIKPPITGVDMYVTSFPARNIRNISSQQATRIVSIGTKRTASSLPDSIPRDATNAPINAAGAASTPKMNCFELERNPNINIGNIDP